MSQDETLADLRWKKFPVLDDGFICLVDVMGDDASVLQAARLSYGKDIRESDPEYNTDTTDFPTKPCNTCGSKDRPQFKGVCNIDCIPEYTGPTYYEKKRAKNDRGLIRYLMRHRHTTPFEMAEVKLLIRIPMDAWRQWIRHRTANVNEYSTRYTEAIDSMQKTPRDQWRLQSKSNKQGSVEEYRYPEDVANRLCESEKNLQDHARRVYQDRLDNGVAREQARKDLPLSTFTEAYWKCDLHNILHFLGLRMDSHAQKEIRDYATILGEEIIAKLFPVTWEAFQDYRMQAMSLSRLDLAAISYYNESGNSMEFHSWLNSNIENDRERAECVAKLRRLGIITNDSPDYGT
jgi:thymidylate synthase (FAD)